MFSVNDFVSTKVYYRGECLVQLSFDTFRAFIVLGTRNFYTPIEFQFCKGPRGALFVFPYKNSVYAIPETRVMCQMILGAIERVMNVRPV